MVWLEMRCDGDVLGEWGCYSAQNRGPRRGTQHTRDAVLRATQLLVKAANKEGWTRRRLPVGVMGWFCPRCSDHMPKT